MGGMVEQWLKLLSLSRQVWVWFPFCVFCCSVPAGTPAEGTDAHIKILFLFREKCCNEIVVEIIFSPYRDVNI